MYRGKFLYAIQKAADMIDLLDELISLLIDEQQKEKMEQIHSSGETGKSLTAFCNCSAFRVSTRPVSKLAPQAICGHL